MSKRIIGGLTVATMALLLAACGSNPLAGGLAAAQDAAGADFDGHHQARVVEDPDDQDHPGASVALDRPHRAPCRRCDRPQ